MRSALGVLENEYGHGRRLEYLMDGTFHTLESVRIVGDPVFLVISKFSTVFLDGGRHTINIEAEAPEDETQIARSQVSGDKNQPAAPVLAGPTR